MDQDVSQDLQLYHPSIDQAKADQQDDHPLTGPAPSGRTFDLCPRRRKDQAAHSLLDPLIRFILWTVLKQSKPSKHKLRVQLFHLQPTKIDAA